MIERKAPTWALEPHGLDGDLLVLQNTGILLRVEQRSGGELVDLVAGAGDVWDLRLYHLLDRHSWRALELCVCVCVCVCVGVCVCVCVVCVCVCVCVCVVCVE